MSWAECTWRRPIERPGQRAACRHPKVLARDSHVTRETCECCSRRVASDQMSSREHVAEGGPAETTCVTRWAVGVTTAPRRNSTLERTLLSLEEAGWDRPRLFVEPTVELPPKFGDLPATWRDETVGAFPNWYLGLTELVMRNPRADAYLLCQDDVLFSAKLRDYLELVLWPAPRVGVVSVYCPSHYGLDKAKGFHVEEHGWATWGALAYVFPNPSARAILSDSLLVNHRHHGPAAGMRNIESVVGGWCARSCLPYYVHVPSLAQHIGETSTIWKHGGLGGRRHARQFLERVDGENASGPRDGGNRASALDRPAQDVPRSRRSGITLEVDDEPPPPLWDNPTQDEIDAYSRFVKAWNS